MAWGKGGHGGQHNGAAAGGRQQTLHTGSNPTAHTAQGAHPRTGLQHWLGGGGHALKARQVGALQGRDDGLAVPAGVGGLDVLLALRMAAEPALPHRHQAMMQMHPFAHCTNLPHRVSCSGPSTLAGTLHQPSCESRIHYTPPLCRAAPDAGDAVHLLARLAGQAGQIIGDRLRVHTSAQAVLRCMRPGGRFAAVER